MGRKKKLENCCSGKDFLGIAQRESRKNPDIEIIQCKSSHVKIRVRGKGAWTLPLHGDRTLGVGIRKATIKAFQALGIATLILLVVLFN